MRQKRVTQKEILLISISLFVIVVLWVGSNIYHAWATSTISEDLQMQIVPIEPQFDTQTLNKLKTRKKIEPVFELSSQIVASSAAEEEESTTIPPPTASILTPTPVEEEPLTLPEEEIIIEEPAPIDESAP